jgi:hypothetical protein
MAVYAIVNQIFGTGHTQHDWNMTLHDEQTAHRLWRGDAGHCIDRIFSCASNAQQQEASHKAKIFVKALQVVDVTFIFNCPINDAR